LDESESIIIDSFQKRDIQITRLQANLIAKNLGCDPLLIGLFSKFLRSDDTPISLLSNNVIDLFIQRNLEEIAQKSLSHFQHFEYNEEYSEKPGLDFYLSTSNEKYERVWGLFSSATLCNNSRFGRQVGRGE
jgi:hypothetical protein